MEYRKFGSTIVVRIDKGEEILDKVREIALKENIKLANINALGAVSEFTVGVFKTDEKKYYSNEFKGYFEIVSLSKFAILNGKTSPNTIAESTIIFSDKL